MFDISSTKRRCRGCIGREQTAAGRPKNASTGMGLSGVDISCDQSSRWQKFAAVPEDISNARCGEKPTVCRRLVTPISQSCSRKRTLAGDKRPALLAIAAPRRHLDQPIALR